MLISIILHIGPEQRFRTLGIRIELDPADRHNRARAPAPPNILQAWRELIAMPLLLQFYVGLALGRGAGAVEVCVVEGADPGVGHALFEGGGEGEGERT